MEIVREELLDKRLGAGQGDRRPMLMVVATALCSACALTLVVFYGGVSGPVDWLMGTVRHGPRDCPVVALTFDDGPDLARTPMLLDVLAELGVRATFFCIGTQVDACPELVARIAREGHEIGNHTYTHRYLPFATSRSVSDELSRTDSAIERVTGAIPVLARPPYGGRSPGTVRAFARHQKPMVLWDVNSFDWNGAPAGKVVHRVLKRTRPGSIILMHDGGHPDANTIDVVRQIVPRLRQAGYALTTVTRLLHPGTATAAPDDVVRPVVADGYGANSTEPPGPGTSELDPDRRILTVRAS